MTKRSVLVIDDDDDVLFLVEYALKHLGFEVACAPGSEEGITLFRERQAAGTPFLAVITDLNIPGGPSGREIARQLHELDETVKVFVSSGYPDDPCMRDCTAYGFAGAIAKPVTVEELLSSFVTRL
ncbi:hypothetical protein GURASL_09370 [Geotalea uraniireducens]|uniref:Response regulatory domain-containing protein n=1 Tax=Geotalea uraniireducens TaxID=351604 RepID=A0ABN6VPU5_9BACT|nr:response regulator [Geotalea uraniireducens]BDV42014.1 hypothetical protein GURASL_09370 [Geotalea uraniireducens]